MQSTLNGYVNIPPAASMPKGSLVVMSVNGTQKNDLVTASALWLGVAFTIGVSVGWYLKGR